MRHNKKELNLDEIANLDRSELVKHWQKLYGNEAPRGISQQLLVRAIAYKMQEKVIGGLKPATLCFLAKVVEDTAAGRKINVPAAVIKTGTRLLREWHGITHEVIVQDSGVQYKGKQYKSLSEVARAITGARWSGPLFFGLKAAEKEMAA